MSLYILSAPSGTGKTTVVTKLTKKHPEEIARVVTCTTRKPRGREMNGKDYHFLSKQEFVQKINDGEFLEHQEIYGQHYGTLRSEVDKGINTGKVVFLIIDVQGAQELKRKIDAKTIFLMPPTFHELERRIRSRKEDHEMAIEERLAKAREEIAQGQQYDYVVTNDNLDETLKIIWDIVNKKHKQEN